MFLRFCESSKLRKITGNGVVSARIKRAQILRQWIKKHHFALRTLVIVEYLGRGMPVYIARGKHICRFCGAARATYKRYGGVGSHREKMGSLRSKFLLAGELLTVGARAFAAQRVDLVVVDAGLREA